MEEVRKAIQKKVRNQPLKKKRIWQAIKESKFAILMGGLCMFEFTIDLACGAYPFYVVNMVRTAVYYGVTKEGIERGTDVVKREMVEQ